MQPTDEAASELSEDQKMSTSSAKFLEELTQVDSERDREVHDIEHELDKELMEEQAAVKIDHQVLAGGSNTSPMLKTDQLSVVVEVSDDEEERFSVTDGIEDCTNELNEIDQMLYDIEKEDEAQFQE